MENIYSGRAWVFGDNINTDIISPPQYMELSIEDSAKYCMNAIRPEFSANVKKGDILVAGDNMGPGSSRETSPRTLKYLGIRIVIAKSFARIFYLNCINIGIIALQCPDSKDIDDQDFLEVFPQKGLIVCKERHKVWSCLPLPANLCELAEAGGLVAYLKQKLNKH